jgi:hypothetical protein
VLRRLARSGRGAEGPVSAPQEAETPTEAVP